MSDLPRSGGRGLWDGSETFVARGEADPHLVFSPLIAIRQRSARARVEALEALTNVDELSVALETMVSVTDAHDVVMPSGDEIDDRFHPEVLLPAPSSSAQRQMALSMERHPLTVVLGPPGTGKTHTIANLLGHLLSLGKRVLVTAEKEEALHEVRDKVLENLRDLVVPVLSGKSEDRSRLAQAISQISGARQERTLVERQEAVSAELEQHRRFRERRSELLNDIVASWENEQGELIASGPYRGNIESVAHAVDRDRDRCAWLTDRPDQSTLPVEDLSPLHRLADPDVAATVRTMSPVPGLAALPSAETVAELVRRHAHLTSQLTELAEVAERPTAIRGPSDIEEADRLSDALASAARSMVRLREIRGGWTD
ncbi:MAG: AAA domain-containing protein, partial [Acidimicrobiia bacterium]